MSVPDSPNRPDPRETLLRVLVDDPDYGLDTPIHEGAREALDLWLADPEYRDALVALLIDAGALELAGYVDIEDPPSGPGVVRVVGREPVYRRVSGGTE
jgi:hypothetical protein